jgi:hypothetical protein
VPWRVVVPAKVAFDIDSMTKLLGKLGERLGCERCLSGASCHFILERDFVVNPETLELERQFGF